MSEEENKLLDELGVILTRREVLNHLDNIYAMKQDAVDKVRIKIKKNDADYQNILEKLKKFYAK